MNHAAFVMILFYIVLFYNPTGIYKMCGNIIKSINLKIEMLNYINLLCGVVPGTRKMVLLWFESSPLFCYNT